MIWAWRVMTIAWLLAMIMLPFPYWWACPGPALMSAFFLGREHDRRSQ